MNVQVQMIADRFHSYSDFIIKRANIDPETAKVLNRICEELSAAISDISMYMDET